MLLQDDIRRNSASRRASDERGRGSCPVPTARPEWRWLARAGKWRSPDFPQARSVRADLPEAVRAIDRPIHPRLERNLCLVAAGRADDGEVLPDRPLVAALVAARPTDVADVVSTLARGPAAGATAGAALGIRGEPLGGVVLLIGRGMDELHATVDAVQGSVYVGHDGSSRAPCRRVAVVRSGQGLLRTGRPNAGIVAGAARPRCRLWSPCRGRTGVKCAAEYNAFRMRALHANRAI